MIVNCRSAVGHTPLHTAAQCHSVEIVARLVAAGANPDALDRGKLTPLQSCRWMPVDPGHRAAIRDTRMSQVRYLIDESLRLSTVAAMRRIETSLDIHRVVQAEMPPLERRTRTSSPSVRNQIVCW